METKEKRILNDYEFIEGELYIKANSLARAIIGSPNFTDGGEEEFLEQDLGIDKEGFRV